MYLLFHIQDPNSFPRAGEYLKNEKSESAISKTSGKQSETAGKGRQNLIYYHPKDSSKGKISIRTGQERKERATGSQNRRRREGYTLQ